MLVSIGVTLDTFTGKFIRFVASFLVTLIGSAIAPLLQSKEMRAFVPIFNPVVLVGPSPTHGRGTWSRKIGVCRDNLLSLNRRQHGVTCYPLLRGRKCVGMSAKQLRLPLSALNRCMFGLLKCSPLFILLRNPPYVRGEP